jgi:RHS repeat-associated protein
MSVFSGTFLPDFGFAHMYRHSVSGMDLTLYRPYNANSGSWLSRDAMDTVRPYSYGFNDPVSNIDPLGLAPVVTVNGNNVNIDLALNFYSPGAQQTAFVQQLLSGINSNWTGTFGKCTVTMHAYAASSGNVTNIFLGGTGNSVNTGIGSDYAVWPPGAINNQAGDYGITPGYIGAHEVGHTMGLYDQYHQQGFKHAPNTGHEDDIMGAGLGGKPTCAEIEYIAKRWAGATIHCCCNSGN